MHRVFSEGRIHVGPAIANGGGKESHSSTQ
jgi:hypothetical protein